MRLSASPPGKLGYSGVLPATAIALFVLVAAWGSPALAKGGSGHRLAGFSGHGGPSKSQGDLSAPSYVLITISSIAHPDAFEAAAQDLVVAIASFGGRVTVDENKPQAWEGSAAEHIVILRFDNPDQARAWKASDAFNSFDTALRTSSTASMLLLTGRPEPPASRAGGWRGGGARLDPGAFEPNVKDYDELINKRMHSICKGC